MTSNPAPAATSADPATAATHADHMIPKARLDEEIAKRRALESELANTADSILADVPEKLKSLIPEGVSAQDKVKWFQKAKATGVFDAKPDASTDAKPEQGKGTEEAAKATAKAAVPTTDTAKPQTTPKDQDLSNMPVTARMAAAYGKT